MIRNTSHQWGSIAQALHWIGALLIIVQLGHGWWMTHLVEREARLPNYAWHADVGYIVLSLVVLRLLWRWVNVTPDEPAESGAFERFLARAGHWGLYALMFAATFSGWALAGTFRQPLNNMFGGLIQVPSIVSSQDRAVHGFFEEVHEWSVYLLLAVVIVHVLSALRHHLVKRNDVLDRMLPFRRGAAAAE